MYNYLWSKYRPALLRLMVDSAEGPQEYKFSNHEFRSVNPKEKGGYSFVLRAYQSKAVNDIRTSIVAKDLLGILKQSKTATELMETAIYEFTLDKQFLLHIEKQPEPEPEPEIEPESETEIEAENEEEKEPENEEKEPENKEKKEAESDPAS